MTPPHILQIERIINAPRAAVWRCWTQAALLKQWYCPKPWHVAHADFDLKPGGRMNISMAGPDGEGADITGIWLEVVPETSLIFTDAFSEGFYPKPDSFMTGHVTFEDTAAGKTLMAWGARHVSEEAKQGHLDMGFEHGWNTAADQLEEVARTLA